MSEPLSVVATMARNNLGLFNHLLGQFAEQHEQGGLFRQLLQEFADFVQGATSRYGVIEAPAARNTRRPQVYDPAVHEFMLFFNGARATIQRSLAEMRNTVSEGRSIDVLFGLPMVDARNLTMAEFNRINAVHSMMYSSVNYVSLAVERDIGALWYWRSMENRRELGLTRRGKMTAVQKAEWQSYVLVTSGHHISTVYKKIQLYILTLIYPSILLCGANITTILKHNTTLQRHLERDHEAATVFRSDIPMSRHSYVIGPTPASNETVEWYSDALADHRRRTIDDVIPDRNVVRRVDGAGADAAHAARAPTAPQAPAAHHAPAAPAAHQAPPPAHAPAAPAHAPAAPQAAQPHQHVRSPQQFHAHQRDGPSAVPFMSAVGSAVLSVQAAAQRGPQIHQLPPNYDAIVSERQQRREAMDVDDDDVAEAIRDMFDPRSPVSAFAGMPIYAGPAAAAQDPQDQLALPAPHADPPAIPPADLSADQYAPSASPSVAQAGRGGGRGGGRGRGRGGGRAAPAA